MKLWKLLRLYPRPLVSGTALLLSILGGVGTVLKVAMPFPAYTMVLGLVLWTYRDKVAQKLRKQPMDLIDVETVEAELLDTEN